MLSSKTSSEIFKLKFLIPFLLLTTIIFSSCYTAQMELRENVSSAQNDSLYIALQKKDSTKFTKSEYAYFHKLKDKSEQELTEAQLKDGGITILWILGIVGGTIGGLYILFGGWGRGC